MKMNKHENGFSWILLEFMKVCFCTFIVSFLL